MNTIFSSFISTTYVLINLKLNFRFLLAILYVSVIVHSVDSQVHYFTKVNNSTLECTMLMIPDYGETLYNETLKIFKGYYGKVYGPQGYPDSVDVKFGEIDVSVVFFVPPSDPEGVRDFRMRELYNKIYVVPNDSRVQDIIRSIIWPHEDIIQLTKFNDLCVFRGSPNIASPGNQFILEFFPDKVSRMIQIEKDKQFCNENPPFQSTKSCILL